MTSAYFFLIVKSTLLLGLLLVVFRMNFEVIFFLNILLQLSVFSKSYPTS